MTKNILGFGEILWDILPNQRTLGGAPFNFAFRVHSLQNNSLFVSRLGIDTLGDLARSRVEELGMNTSFIQRDCQHATGTVHVTFDENQIPDYVINTDVAYDYIQLEPDLISAAQYADCFCYGTLVQRASVSQSTLEQLLLHSPHSLKFYDINLRKQCYSQDAIKWSLNFANILKLNDAEVQALIDMFHLPVINITDFCRYAVKTWDLDYCLVTCGAQGAVVCSHTGELHYHPGYTIQVADTLGAGDAFSAGFVHKYLWDADADAACGFGNLLGALTASQVGGTTPITNKEIANFRQQKHQRLFHPEFSHLAA